MMKSKQLNLFSKSLMQSQQQSIIYIPNPILFYPLTFTIIGGGGWMDAAMLDGRAMAEK
jgi:hypothetical protein